MAINIAGDIVDLQVIDASGEQLSYVGPYRGDISDKGYRGAPWFQEVLVKGRLAQEALQLGRAHVLDVHEAHVVS